MGDEAVLLDAQTAAALANPRRQQILLALGEPSTISQLAHRLAINKGSVSHHLGVLAGVELVAEVSTRTVRGGTEVYYQRTTRRVIIAHEERDGAGAAMIEAVAAGMTRDQNRHLHHRTLRMTQRQADHLAQHLDDLISSLEPAPPPETEFGVVVSIYRKR